MAMSGKWKISVDTAVIANGDSIASYLVSASGALISSVSIGGNEHLRVKSASDFAEDSAHVSGDFGSFIMGVRSDAGSAFGADGDYVPFSMDSQNRLRVAADLVASAEYAEDSAHTTGDIGNFQLAVRRDTRSSGVDTDGDYASFNVNANGELYTYDQDANASLDAIEASTASMDTSLNNIEADADEMNTSLNNIEGYINDLRKAEDSVHSSGDYGIQFLAVRKDSQGSNAADGDYTSFQTWSEGSLKVVDVANGALLQQEVSVATTATLLPATAQASRKRLLVQNVDTASVWIGAATVTSSGATGGIEVPRGGHIELECGPAVSVYAIASGSARNVRVLELS